MLIMLVDGDCYIVWKEISVIATAQFTKSTVLFKRFVLESETSGAIQNNQT